MKGLILTACAVITVVSGFNIAGNNAIREAKSHAAQMQIIEQSLNRNTYTKEQFLVDLDRDIRAGREAEMQAALAAETSHTK